MDVTTIITSMENILEEFRQTYSAEIYDQLQAYIEREGLMLEFVNCQTLDQLFKFALKYGILYIIEFLYEHKRVPYNPSILTTYVQTLEPTPQSNMTASVVSDKGAKSGLSVMKMDRYTSARAGCIEYLVRARKWSVYAKKNGAFVYQYRGIKG